MNKKTVIGFGSALVVLGILFFVAYKFLPLIQNKSISNINNFPPIATTTQVQNNNNAVVQYAEPDPKDTRESISDVVWQNPVKITSLPVWNSKISNKNQSIFYLVGKINSGKYSGNDVIRIVLADNYWGEIPGPGGDFDYILATKNENGIYGSFKLIIYDTNYIIGTPYNDKVSYIAAKFKDLEMPQIITVDGSNFEYQGTYGEWHDSLSFLVAASSTPVGEIFYTKDGSTPTNLLFGSFFVKTKDSMVASYKFMDVEKLAKKTDQNTGITLDNSSIQEIGDYRYTEFGGCGSSNVTSVVSIPDSSLVAIGHANFNGGTIYGLKDSNDPIIKNVYDSVFSYDYGNTEKIPYDVFIQDVPVFFWKDKFGRLIKFTSEKYIPPVECGKPVIYLYPTSTTTVSVKIIPQGGFTKTEPNYGNGWNVLATPESVLTNLSDDKTYSYLFWEGRGGLYQSPDRGWVIEKSKISEFLDKTLDEYGLNKKEIADFKEFWLPRMQEKPYYFISFYDNKVMDVLAPLSISPKPDSVIRVLMDFKGLDKPIKVEGYNIPKRARNGFTVIEWGGVLQ